MDQNEEFIRNVKIEDIPWKRITTAYGMAAELPGYLKTLQDMSQGVRAAFREIITGIEHQSTLWHATPFALIFLVRIYHDAVKKKESNKTAAWLTEQLKEFFDLILECCRDLDDVEIKNEKPLPLFSDMLKEEYLWPEDMDEEEEDERWEEGFSDELLVSFWYYSYEVVKEFDV